MNLLQDEVEMYQPIKYATVAGNDPVYVFSIQRRLIDYRDIHKEVGSVLISVDERVLQDAMKGTGSEIFVLEQDGRVLSAPNNSMIGSTIRLDQISRIGNRSYSEYKAASVTNEKSGWNIVEFYPLFPYQKTMRDQFWLQVGMVSASALSWCPLY